MWTDDTVAFGSRLLHHATNTNTHLSYGITFQTFVTTYDIVRLLCHEHPQPAQVWEAFTNAVPTGKKSALKFWYPPTSSFEAHNIILPPLLHCPLSPPFYFILLQTFCLQFCLINLFNSSEIYLCSKEVANWKKMSNIVTDVHVVWKLSAIE